MKNLPLEQIAKLADDIRTITNFAENHNFNASLLTVAVPSTRADSALLDRPLIGMAVSITLVIAILAILKFWPSLSPAISNFLFLVGIIIAILAAVCSHLRFKEKTITSITVLGLVAVLFLGAGIFTPKEAVDQIRELLK
jgi:hypothetical protein